MAAPPAECYLADVSLPLKPFDALLLAGFALCLFLFAGPVLGIPLHIPINYNEGWNALFDTRAVTPGAGPLYPPRQAFVFDNYPPLGFYIVGSLGRFVFGGDMILAGRIADLLSLFAAAGLTGACVRLLGGGLRAALAASLLLLLTMGTYYRQYLAMDDPQWLAQAIMLAGLAVLLRFGGVACLAGAQVPATAIVCAALLMVAGAFVKHNLIALPLAVTLWLAITNWRAAAVWAATGALALGLGAAAIAMLHGPVAFADILEHRRVFRASLWTRGLKQTAPLLPMALAAALLLRRDTGPQARAARLFAAIFALLAIVTGIFQRTGEGVYYNAHFETVVAVCLAFGMALSPVFGSPVTLRRRAIGPLPLALFAALPLVAALPWHAPAAWRDITERHAREAAWQPVIARIAAADGHAGCLMMSLCWWAGRPSEIDMFNLTQSVLAGGPLEPFQAAVSARHFAIFEDDPASFTHSDAVRALGHDPIMESFHGRYAVAALGPAGIVLLAPRLP